MKKGLKYIARAMCVLSAASLLLIQGVSAEEIIPPAGIQAEEKMIIAEAEGTNVTYYGEDGEMFVPSVNLDCDSTVEYPSTFDLRDVNGNSYITRPECQYNNDCWTYASISCLESSAMMQGYGEQHFSKSHLCYFSLTPTTEGIKSDTPFKTGGNTGYVVGALSNLEGIANKSDFPNAFDSTVVYDEADRYNRDSGFILDEAVDLSDMNEMKEWLMTEGAVYASYYQVGVEEYIYNGVQNTNHGITIIGWDDTIPASNFSNTYQVTDSDGNVSTVTYTPSRDGGWIVKNTIGFKDFDGTKLEYYDNNYKYLSYDQYLGCSVGLKAQKDPGILNNYTYTERNVYNYYSGKNIKYANVFTAENNEAINQIGFEISNYYPYVTSNEITDVTVTVQIYKNIKSNYEDANKRYHQDESGTLAGTFTKHYDKTGYYTFEIPETITVSKSEIYSVVISMSDSNGAFLNVPLERTYENSIYTYTGEEGQSFLTTSENGVLTDSYDYNNLANCKGVRNVFMHVYTTCNHIEATKETDEYNIVYCTQCGEQLRSTCKVHTFDEGIVVSAASCTQQGETLYTCTVCGEEKTEYVPMKGHTVVNDNGYAATCTKDGLTDGTHCSVCKQTLTKQTAIPKTGHTPYVSKQGTEKTCTTDGSTDEIICSVCKELIQAQTVSPAGHTDKNSDGICEVCNALYNKALNNQYKLDRVTISAPNDKGVSYKNRVKFTVSASGLPEGYTIALYENGRRVDSNDSSIGYTSGELTSNVKYTVKVIAPDGSVAKTSSGAELSKSFNVSVNSGFFQKLIAFFKGLFGGQPIVNI